MNIEEFKDNMSEEKKEVELTEEQKKQVEDFYLQKGAYEFKNYISDIKKYIITNKITLQDAIDEVNNKKSRLSSSRRKLLLAISPEIWAKWIPINKPIVQVNYEDNKS